MADMNGLNGQRVQTSIGIEQKTQNNLGRDTKIDFFNLQSLMFVSRMENLVGDEQ